MTKKHNVKIEQIEQFALINEKVFEKTAYAESKAYAKFKDLSLLQMQVIRLINYHNPCTMGKLAKSFGLSLSGITQLIDRLIKKDYVKRIRSEDDRRVVFAELTTKGKRVVKASRKHVEIFAENVLCKFTNSEQKLFLNFFERIIDD